MHTLAQRPRNFLCERRIALHRTKHLRLRHAGDSRFLGSRRGYEVRLIQEDRGRVEHVSGARQRDHRLGLGFASRQRELYAAGEHDINR
jgi:hypothetical protein